MYRFTRVASAVLFSIFIFLGASGISRASDDISVSNIAPTYVEKGTENYMVTVQAHVTNNGPADNNHLFEVIAVDEEGFQLQATKMSGHVKSGATRVFTEQIKMSRDIYEQIAGWELKE